MNIFLNLEHLESEEMQASKTELHLPGHDKEMRRQDGEDEKWWHGHEHVVTQELAECLPPSVAARVLFG